MAGWSTEPSAPDAAAPAAAAPAAAAPDAAKTRLQTLTEQTLDLLSCPPAPRAPPSRRRARFFLPGARS